MSFVPATSQTLPRAREARGIEHEVAGGRHTTASACDGVIVANEADLWRPRVFARVSLRAQRVAIKLAQHATTFTAVLVVWGGNEVACAPDVRGVQCIAAGRQPEAEL